MRAAAGALRIVAVAAALLLVSATAHAARVATVDVEGTEVHEGPGKGYKLVEKLTRGSYVTAANIPVEGWYKVRTQSNSVGWVPADSLILGGDASSPPPAVSNSPVVPAPATQTFDYTKPAAPGRKWVTIRGLFGAEFLAMSGVNTLVAATGSTGLDTQLTTGGEVGVWALPWLGVLIRAEYLFRSTQSRDSSGNNYEFDSNALPLMAGIEFRVFDTKWVAGRVSAYGGYAVWTDLRVFNTAIGSSPFTELTAPGFTGLGKVALDFKVTGPFYLFVEGGYRYLASAQITPVVKTPAATADSLFKANGVFQPVALDFNGILVAAGVTLTF